MTPKARPHRAKPEVWAAVEKLGKNEMNAANCALELRARVEALEAATIIDVEACLGEVSFLNSQALADRVRVARRQKPLSLKEQALEALASAPGPDYPNVMTLLNADQHALIRRALESIPDLS